MVVNIKLMSMFARYLKNHPDGKVDVEEGTSGKVLSDGDLVYIFPPAIGGG
jgi:molybdopterin converting factor small subunit